jgi:hypothetical protein
MHVALVECTYELCLLSLRFDDLIEAGHKLLG